MRTAHESRSAGGPLSRRDFLSLAAWAGVLTSGLAGLAQSLRFLQPTLTHTPSVFSVGSPGEYPIGSRRLIQTRRVLILRDAQGFRAMSAVCTHLGCTVTLVEWGFSCPCHGSKFDLTGVNFAGPAPRPLPAFRLYSSPEGELMVDTRQIVPRDQFFDPFA